MVSAIRDTVIVDLVALAQAPLQIPWTLAANSMMSAIYTIEIEELEGIATIYFSNVYNNIPS